MTTLFGMAWLSYLLLPDDNRKHWLPRWSRQHWPFLLYGLVVSAVQLLFWEVEEAIRAEWSGLYWNWRISVAILLSLPVAYVHASLGLAFCALAAGRPGSPLWSWRLIGWAALKIVVIISVASSCLSFIGAFAGVFLDSLSTAAGLPRILEPLSQTLANYASYAIVLGTFAVAYRELAGPEDEILKRFD